MNTCEIHNVDGPPDDKAAFFGHPLTRATITIDGEAQSEALLHEYFNLQAMDDEGGKIGDRLTTYMDLVRYAKNRVQIYVAFFCKANVLQFRVCILVYLSEHTCLYVA